MRQEDAGRPGGLAFDREEVRTLRDRIADRIRTLIIDGGLTPGDRLVEPDLATRLGVSRTPLREALLQLDSEGFVRVTPRRGAVVSVLSHADAAETYQVKGVLEAFAARLACAQLQPETMEALRALHERMRRIAAARTKDVRTLLQLNAEFHQTLSDASGNEKLAGYIRSLRAQALRYNYIYLSVLSHLTPSMKEHERILAALAKRDAALVERLVRAHGDAAGKALCAYIDSQTGGHQPQEPQRSSR
ncbi:MAG: GntR family transcriptional regulator [Ignavibacteriae bacterium]|jgi:DNA-binding GntR family transcriptional regulator|nr:GntR family transcriptional regulator [Ignavibacteriota bacterium]